MFRILISEAVVWPLQSGKSRKRGNTSFHGCGVANSARGKGTNAVADA